MPTPRQQQDQRHREAVALDPEREQTPPTHPRGPRSHRRAQRLATLLRQRPPARVRAAAAAPSPFPPMDRGRPVTPEQVAAATERRAQASTRKAGRVTRAERLHLLRLDNPQATKSDLRALLHSLARDRRDGV